MREKGSRNKTETVKKILVVSVRFWLLVFALFIYLAPCVSAQAPVAVGTPLGPNEFGLPPQRPYWHLLPSLRANGRNAHRGPVRRQALSAGECFSWSGDNNDTSGYVVVTGDPANPYLQPPPFPLDEWNHANCGPVTWVSIRNTGRYSLTCYHYPGPLPAPTYTCPAPPCPTCPSGQLPENIIDYRRPFNLSQEQIDSNEFYLYFAADDQVQGVWINDVFIGACYDPADMKKNCFQSGCNELHVPKSILSGENNIRILVWSDQAEYIGMTYKICGVAYTPTFTATPTHTRTCTNTDTITATQT